MIVKKFVDKLFEKIDDPNFDINCNPEFDINNTDNAGRTLLFLACKICDFTRIKKLISLQFLRTSLMKIVHKDPIVPPKILRDYKLDRINSPTALMPN